MEGVEGKLRGGREVNFGGRKKMRFTALREENS